MIKRAILGKEIEVVVNNEIGALAKVTSFLVNHGINVEAVEGYATGSEGEAVLMFVTNNNPAAIKSLQEHGYCDLRETEVVIVEIENRPGTLKNISEILAQNGVDIITIYSTTCSGGCPTKIVLSTSDNYKAFVALSE